MSKAERKIFKESLRDAIKGILLRKTDLKANDYPKLQEYSEILLQMEREVKYV